MESQLSLFQFEETSVAVADIRTEKQITNKIAYDAGVKIGGSRKELAMLRKAFEEKANESTLEEMENFSASLAAEMITKKELFKNFSLEQEKEKGTEPSVAKAKQLLLQRVAQTPSIDSKEGRLRFMKAAQYLFSILEPIITFDELRMVLNELSLNVSREKSNRFYYEKEIIKMENELPVYQEDSEDYIKLANKITKFNGYIQEIDKAKKLGLRSLGQKFCNFFSGRYYPLDNALKVKSWDELLEKKEKAKGAVRKPVWERNLPDRPDRTGGAQSVIEKPEDLISFFQFRGVEFGHYVDDMKATEHLLRSSEAMMDLADLLGIDYTSISLNGTLGIGFGSRGRGGNALAHFEPLANVINMTRDRGCLGVFAHEWFHALDCYLHSLSHNKRNGKKGYASDPETLGEHIDSILSLLFYELIDVMKKGTSIGYIENKNTPGIRWRGTSFIQAYERHNGDLLKAMQKEVISEKENLESSAKFYSYYSSTTEKDLERLNKKMDKNIKSFAQAIAWYHEEQTGERVEYIPYPSDKSQYLQASISLDRGKIGKYWSSHVEMAARAFESFIQDKLNEAGRRSDYLVAGSRDGAAFPMGEERVAINKKFEAIIEVIKDLKLL